MEFEFDGPQFGRVTWAKVMIPVNGGDLPVFVVTPERRGPWPRMVVLHDVGGMKEDLRNQARWLAQEGFLAAAPNLYLAVEINGPKPGIWRRR